MSSNFTVTGPAALVAIAACGQTTGLHGSSDDPGENVTFAFGRIRHNITFDTPYGAAPAAVLGVDVSVSVQRTFSSPGTYRYHCTIHQGGNGSIVVQ